MDPFGRSFTQQDPLPEPAIERAVAVLRSGRLHRYGAEPSEASLLEQEFAAWLGVPHALACASGGYALYLALLAVGVRPGDAVLCNAFTLAPVPGAIHNAGARPVFVEVTPDCTLDLDHLKQLAPGARFLLLSYMRGHVPDMDALLAICREHDVTIVEDCAHTLGARWKGKLSGTFGRAACFSTQTYKHLNSGEGGLLATSDPDVIARATLLSGSYMLYARHGTSPPEDVFEGVRLSTPNYSGRMDELRAAVLRPQLATLDARCAAWNQRYRVLEAGLRAIPGVRVPVRPPAEAFVGSSIQFSLPGANATDARKLVAGCHALGVTLHWVGDPEPVAYTSRFESWAFAGPSPELPATQRLLDGLFDMRIPLPFSLEDCEHVARIVAHVIGKPG